MPHRTAALALALTITTTCAAWGQTMDLSAESSRYLSVVFVEKVKTSPFNADAAGQAAHYTITSRDDANYAAGRKPTRVGRESRLLGFEDIEWPYRIETVEHRINLQLPEPMQPGAKYIVKVDAAVAFGRAKALTLTWDDTKRISRNIKVNQVGYLPTAGLKIGYLGGYLGSMGALPLDDVSQFFIVDAKSGKHVFEGKPHLTRRDDADSGENVYELDFSSFSQPGDYAIVVPGVGRSCDFRIGDDVYADVFFTVARGLYHQRCGIALRKPFTQFPHGACHTDKAQLTTAEGDDDNLKVLPSKVIPGKFIDGHGGWHDAADYDRRGGHITVPMQLMTIYEIAPTKFRDRQLNLPESGNGVPDILDEACWGLDWFVRMQDQADGGIHYRVETAKFAYHVAPEKDTQPLYAYAKDTWTTIHFAGTAAQASRVLRAFDAGKADAYMAAAEKAWQYGRAHLETGDRRQMAATSYAAAELYKTTGKSEYHDVFKNTTVDFSSCWTYATCERPDVDQTIQRACRSRVINQAKKFTDAVNEPGYHHPSRRSPSWGSGSNTPRYAMAIIQGYVLTGEAPYRDAALAALDHQLGANPLGMTFITGIGSRPAAAVAHNPSYADNIDEPVPGIPIYGVARMYGAASKVKLYWSVQFPGDANGYVTDGSKSNYPMFRRWSPEPRIYIMNEFTVQENMGPATFCYGFFLPD